MALSIAEILESYDVERAFLFGSYARGDNTADSDVDLRFECGPTMSYGALYEISQKLENVLGTTVDIVTNPPEYMRPRFRKCIKDDEVLLYESTH